MPAKGTETLVEAFTPYPGVAVAILYGSHASARQRDTSDIDIAVAFETVMSTEQRLALHEHLAQQLKRPIDLVDLFQAHGVLLNEIISRGKVVVKRNPEVYARFIARAMFENADFMPHYQAILAQRRFRYIHATPSR